MITSTGNNQVREINALVKKSKERKEQGLFIVEGVRMFSELPEGQSERVYVTDSFLRLLKKREIIQEAFFKSIRVETVSDEVMKYMSDTQTPQGILAVVKQFSYELKEVLSGREDRKAHLLVLESLQDPGNLGTILRAGEGAGITGIIMNRETADIYNPKVIRSTMGSIYRVPFTYVDDLEKTLPEVKKSGIRLFAGHLKGERNYEEENYCADTGFLVGNEARGLSESVTALADCYVRIPMAGKVESLNAAVAASVLMFETARQRRAKTKTF